MTTIKAIHTCPARCNFEVEVVTLPAFGYGVRADGANTVTTFESLGDANRFAMQWMQWHRTNSPHRPRSTGWEWIDRQPLPYVVAG